MWGKHTKSISNAKDLKKINLDRDKYNIYEINLYRLEDECFSKLLEITQWSPLLEVNLRDCFDDAEKLKQILEALVDNSAIKNLSLSLRGNAFDFDCVGEMTKLLSRKVVRSLTLPEGLEAILLTEILREILGGSVELKELNISRSILDPEGIELLEKILQNKLIKEKLGMMGCQGVAETTLTSNDKKKLSEAVRNSRGYFPFSLSRNLSVTWFTYVKHAEVSAQRDGHYELIEVEDHIRPIFKGKLGQAEKVIRLIARDKKMGDRQLLKTTRKRKHGDVVVSTKPKKIKEEVGVDALSDQFRRNTLESLESASHDVMSSPQSEKEERGKNWNELSDSTSCSITPTKSPTTTRPFELRRIYDEAYSPMNKAHGFNSADSLSSNPDYLDLRQGHLVNTETFVPLHQTFYFSGSDVQRQRSLGVPISFSQGLQNSPVYPNCNRIHNNLEEVYSNPGTGTPVKHLQRKDDAALLDDMGIPFRNFDGRDLSMIGYESPRLQQVSQYHPLRHNPETPRNNLPQHSYDIHGQGALSTLQVNAIVSAKAEIPLMQTPTTNPRNTNWNSHPRGGSKETQRRRHPPPLTQGDYAAQQSYNYDRQFIIKNESQACPRRSNNKGRRPWKRRPKKEKTLTGA